MAQWGMTDNASNSVNYATELTGAGPVGSGSVAKAANNTTLYGNTTVSAFTSTVAVGQFGVSAAEMANTSGEASKVTHAGWNLRKAGTGPVVSVVPLVGGIGYSNTNLVRVSGGTVNASATLVTNSTGGILTTALVTPGEGFINISSATVAVTNATGGASAGSNATFTLTLGGRAGLVHYETIIAAGSMSNGTSDDSIFPQ